MLISMKEFTEQVAAKVRAEMASRRMTITNLSDATGIAHKTLSRRLSGKSAWTTDELYSVAKSLGAPIGQLLDVGTAPSKKEVLR
ncbi:MAG: helix-turn-helix transcriptional regulator [Propionibacteriaceae bacterium]|jgi:transcriptional regulator with XRE-family HTH domain|nr:helix-turn-helix transcriptional regulator [Propionibacteriaceae bacterium]